jgi:hypothetical protein
VSDHFDPNKIDDRDIAYLTTIPPGVTDMVTNLTDYPLRVYTQKAQDVLQTTKGTEPSAR